MTISLRVDKQLARRLEAAARARGLSKSELLRQCLEEYLSRNDKQPTAWELGKDLFGCYDSGLGHLSERAEEIVKQRIHAKLAKANGKK